MVVDVGFSGIGSRRTNGPIAKRPRPTAVNLTGEAMRQHEKLMESRHEISRLNSDLCSAMSSLASSNAEIDRLKARVIDLESELKDEREKNDKLSMQLIQQKQTKRSKKEKAEDAKDTDNQ